MGEHPVRIVVEDDLRRSRLTVFFRLLLAVPHYFWLGVWTFGVLFAVPANWIATLVRGTAPASLHGFLAGYIRYSTHVNAYLFLAANPFPGFLGHPGSYPVDVEIEPPARQNRWTVGFRLLLAVPALVVASVFIGAGGNFGGGRAGWYALFLGGITTTVAFLAWFACLVRGRMPDGFRDLQAYGLRYVAQVDAYIFVLTDRYPDSRTGERRPREHPIGLHVEDDLHRSRLTTFFRLLLAIPHFVWLLLWSLLAFFAAIANWLATLVRGTPPTSLHRFLAAYVRYSIHVSAFLFLVANPFPGFTGAAGSYPVDVPVAPPERQSRWTTGFRMLLAVPAFVVQGAVANLAFVAGFLGWFAALATGRMPRGLRDAGAYALRYSAQTYGYACLLSDRYPFSGPPA